MRNIIAFILPMLILNIIFAQTPEKLSYQAIVRNSSNLLISNTQVGMKISILQGSVSGSAVYEETQTPTTNINGLVSIEIGNGTVVSGNFSTIDWATGPYFIKTETDPSGGTSYSITGTSQLLSVPYALHAKTAESISGGITETDPIFTAHPANNISATNISNWNSAYGWGNHATAGYLTSYTETDPIFTAHTAHGITTTNINNWNTAYGWGNHATAGYLTSYTETDPIFTAHVAHGITSTNINNWNTAFGWGNHAGLYRPISYVPAWSEITSNPFSISTPANNQLLKYNNVSGKWENWTPSFITAEVDGSVTNEIELPTQTGNSGKFLTTDGTVPAWSLITKTAVGLGNVENTTLSTWPGSTNIITTGTITSGIWQGTAITATYIDNLPASKITSGIFDNARINWAAPGNIGSTTPTSGAFTSLSANSGLIVSNGNVNIKPSGSSGTNGQVLTTDGSGNATWQSVSASRSIRTANSNVTLTSTDEVVIVNGAYTITLPATPTNGQILYICGANSSAYIYTNGRALRAANTNYAAGNYSFTDLDNFSILIYDSSANVWHLRL